MRIVIDLEISAPARRRRLLSMAEKRRAVAKRVRSITEGWTLKALGIAARAGYVGFDYFGRNNGAPEDALRYLRAARRYDRAADRIDDRADELEREANGSAQRASTPKGVA